MTTDLLLTTFCRRWMFCQLFKNCLAGSSDLTLKKGALLPFCNSSSSVYNIKLKNSIDKYDEAVSLAAQGFPQLIKTFTQLSVRHAEFCFTRSRQVGLSAISLHTLPLRTRFKNPFPRVQNCVTMETNQLEGTVTCHERIIQTGISDPRYPRL